MPVGCEIWILCDRSVSPDDVDKVQDALVRALGTSSYTDGEWPRFAIIERARADVVRDCVDAPSATQYLEAWTEIPFFDEEYQRGDFSQIQLALDVIRLMLAPCRVHYGPDGKVFPSELTPQRQRQLFDLFVQLLPQETSGRGWKRPTWMRRK